MTDESNRGNASETDMFDPMREAVESAIDFADRYGDPYREHIFKHALAFALSGGEDMADTGQLVALEPTSGGMAGLADALGVDPDDLVRVVDVADGNVSLYGEVGGSSRSERANRAASAYLFLKEQILGEREADLDELKEVCRSGKRDAVDSNFTRNLSRGDYLVEADGKPGSTNKSYRLLPAGEDAAQEVLRYMVGEVSAD